MGQSLCKTRSRREAEAAGAAPVPRQPPGPISAAAQQLFPRCGMIPMTRKILIEFSRALDRGFGDLQYGIIGPAAFSEYNVNVYPASIDVVISPETCNMAKAQLLQRKVGIISLDEDRTRSELLGFAASDGQLYCLYMHSDRALAQGFCRGIHTIESRLSRAQVATPAFLINSWAYFYMKRATSSQKAAEFECISFLLRYMISKGSRAGSEQCRWAVDYQFWSEFTENMPGTEDMLKAIGLQCGPAPDRRTNSSQRLGATHQSSGSSTSRSNPRTGSYR